MSGTGSRRIGCCVPGCRRTFRAETCRPGVEYVCGRCFKLADLPFRQRYGQLKKRLRTLERYTTNAKARRAIFEKADARGRTRSINHHVHDRRMRAAFARCWKRIVGDAEIKLAMGAPGAPRRRSAA